MPPDFNLGEYVGIGLSTKQIGFLAGVIFFTIFAYIAIRRAQNTGGLGAAIWGNICVGLLAASVYVASVGLAEYLPEWLQPFTKPQELQRAAILAGLGCWAFVLLSAHSAPGELTKWLYRVAGVSCLGVGIYFGIAWFQQVELAPEFQRWTTSEMLLQMGIGISLVFLMVALWFKGRWSEPHVMWAYRSFIPLIGGALMFAIWQQYRTEIIPEDWQQFPFPKIIMSLTMIAVICGLLITLGAYFMREQRTTTSSTAPIKIAPKPVSNTKPLPVAIQLDAAGNPIIPAK